MRVGIGKPFCRRAFGASVGNFAKHCMKAVVPRDLYLTVKLDLIARILSIGCTRIIVMTAPPVAINSLISVCPMWRLFQLFGSALS